MQFDWSAVFWYQKLVPNRAAFYSVQVSGISFVQKFPQRVSPLLVSLEIIRRLSVKAK